MRAPNSRVRTDRSLPSPYGYASPAASVDFAILGAGGSIGNAVARRARLGGHAVRAVVRRAEPRLGLPPGTEVHAADLLDARAVVAACDSADVIVHAANAPYSEWPKLVPAMAQNALRAAEAAGALLVLPGNVYVYGRAQSNPVREDHPREPHTLKGRIRLRIEEEWLRAHKEGRARVLIPRYPDFYGPNVVNELMRPIFEGALAGRPCGWPINADVDHEFILIDDAAAALLSLVQRPAAHGHVVHVPGPGPVHAREFIRLAYKSGGHTPRLRVYSRATMRAAGIFNRTVRAAMEMSYLFENPLLLDGSLYRTLTGSPHPATPYAEGARRTVEWFRTHLASAKPT